MKRLAWIVALCLTANVSCADLFDGNIVYRFFEQCEKFENGDKSIENYWNCGVSKGYVAGIHDAWFGQAFCTPEDASLGQVAEVVHLWLKNHPDDRSYSAESLVLAALHESWPCPEK